MVDVSLYNLRGYIIQPLPDGVGWAVAAEYGMRTDPTATLNVPLGVGNRDYVVGAVAKDNSDYVQAIQALRATMAALRQPQVLPTNREGTQNAEA